MVDRSKRAVFVAVTAGLVTLFVLIARAVLNGEIDDASSKPRISHYYVVTFLGMLVVGSFVTVGVPILLSLRYGLLSPFVVLALDLLFWLVIVGDEVGPNEWFTVMFWPAYLAGYLLLGGVEYYLRSRNILPPLPTVA